MRSFVGGIDSGPERKRDDCWKLHLRSYLGQIDGALELDATQTGSKCTLQTASRVNSGKAATKSADLT
jgi:hypothetical protein